MLNASTEFSLAEHPALVKREVKPAIGDIYKIEYVCRKYVTVVNLLT